MDLTYWSEGSIAGRGALARWHGGTWWHIRCRGHVRGGLGAVRRHYYLGPRPGWKCSCSLSFLMSQILAQCGLPRCEFAYARIWEISD